MKKLRGITLLLLLLTALVSCGAKVETLTFGTPDSAEKILIAMESSEYKLQLAKELANFLDNGSRYIVITGLEVLKKTDPADYRAVIIINTVRAGKPAAKARKFVARYPNNGNIAVVNTWGGEPGMLEMEADTLSSASNMTETVKVMNEVLMVLRL